MGIQNSILLFYKGIKTKTGLFIDISLNQGNYYGLSPRGRLLEGAVY
jgi:hypothetical protein